MTETTDKRRSAGTIVAIALLTMVLLCVMAMPVAATYTETKYASYQKGVWDNGPHIVLGYYIPHDTLGGDFSGNRYHPYVGGVDYWVLANSAPSHSNPQEWDYYSRVQVNANWDRVELFIPKRYILAMNALQRNWENQIYIRYYRR